MGTIKVFILWILATVCNFKTAESVQYNITISSHSGHFLQNYLCHGQLKSNMTLVLDHGEHAIYLDEETPCLVYNLSNIMIVGSSVQDTIVYCYGMTQIQFLNVQNVMIQNVHFLCSEGIHTPVLKDKIPVPMWIFLSISSSSNINVHQVTISKYNGASMLGYDLENVTFSQLIIENSMTVYSDNVGILMLDKARGTISIRDCTFYNNIVNGIKSVVMELHLSSGTLNTENCTFINNTVNGEDAKVVLVEVEDGTTSITNCTFKKNTANGNSVAAVLELSGTTDITNCTLISNNAIGESAVIAHLHDSSSITIMFCTVMNNNANGMAAAVVVGQGGTTNFTIANCTFKNNIANGKTIAEVIELEGTNDIIIKQCTFINNIANGEQATVLFPHKSASITITYCAFIYNNASGVSAIVLNLYDNICITITYCTFMNNTTDGGNTLVLLASAQIGNATCSIINCTFVNNNVIGKDFAVVLYGSGGITVKYCMFVNNTANEMYPRVVELHGTTGLVITSCTFKNNTANGSGAVILRLYCDTGITITYCMFQNNNANGESAVIIFSQGTTGVKVSLSTFMNNSVIGGSVVVILMKAQNNTISITNCTFMNNNANGRAYGAVIKLSDTTDVTITYCTFVNNNANAKSVGVITPHETISTTITYCTFVDNNANGNTAGVISLINDTIGITITYCIFMNNNASGVTATVLFLYCYTGVTITYSMFMNNFVNGENAALVLAAAENGTTNITNCTFINNNAIGNSVGVLELDGTKDITIIYCMFINNSAYGENAVIVSPHDITGITITYCTFMNNNANGWNAGVIAPSSITGITMTFCTFINNNATAFAIVDTSADVRNSTFQGNIGGAIIGDIFRTKSENTYQLYKNNNKLNIVSCAFEDNSAKLGGAIYVVSTELNITNSSFTRNVAVFGAAIYFSDSIQGHVNLTLNDVVVQNNKCLCEGLDDPRGGAVYFSATKMSIMGAQFTSNYPKGAIQGLSGEIHISGDVTFSSNTGEDGGAIRLTSNTQVFIHDYSTVIFDNNKAEQFGGALFIDGEKIYLCQVFLLYNNIQSYSTIHINFIDNYAGLSGHAIYAKSVQFCIPIRSQNIVKLEHFSHSPFSITPFQNSSVTSPITSFPRKINFCDCDNLSWCNFTTEKYKIRTQPGRKFVVFATSVDEYENTSPSWVHVQINGTESQNVTLGDQQNVQWVPSQCSSMEFQVFGLENTTFYLLLTPFFGNPPPKKLLSCQPGYQFSSTIVEITILPCEPGFELTTGILKCDCSQFLKQYGASCNTSYGTISKHGNNWIGMYMNSPAYVANCPLSYCIDNITNMSLVSSDVQCNGGRTGVLCGQCPENYSTVFGSSECHICSNLWLSTILLYSAIGAILVVVLFVFNLTVTQGTLYGLIFYANLIQINTHFFFSQSGLRPLQVIISFINLDLGFSLCFYNGMDDAAKAGLQFVFPTYLLILTITVIVVLHYCYNRAPDTSSSAGCISRLKYTVGNRAVGVLATLIYLSYSKLLRTIVDILTYSSLHLPDDDSIQVWFYDGNIRSWKGKHIVLVIIAMVVSVFFLLPYVVGLTFIPIIERYSEYNRVFDYLHKKAIKVKPFSDTCYAPYKGEWKCWLGARLWLLMFFHALNPVYSSDNPPLLLTIHVTVLIVFITIQTSIMPFGMSIQTVYRCCHRGTVYNALYNCLDLFYLLNYTILVLYALKLISDNSAQTSMMIGVFVGLYVMVFIIIVFYHWIVTVLQICKCYDTVVNKINDALYSQNRPQHNSLLENTDDYRLDGGMDDLDDSRGHLPLLDVV